MNEGEIQFAERLRRIGFAIYSGGHMRRKEFIRRAIEAAANAVGAVILLELYWKWKDARHWQEYKPKWKDPQSK
jgi:hypothetical protein